MSTFPVVLNNLEQQRVIVVGGGAVAEEKVQSLLEGGAGSLAIISPELTPVLRRMAAAGRVEWIAREYRPGDLRGAFLCIAATDDSAINHAVAAEAKRERVLINVVDDPAYCDFYATSVVRRGGFTISIGTDGQMPALAAHLRRRLARGFGPEYGVLIHLARQLRPTMSRRFPDPAQRRRAWQALAESNLIPLIRRGASDEQLWEHIERTLARFAAQEPGRLPTIPSPVREAAP
ncbi:MAG: bifunctional precorrin-2 dehydrogenase/sirohydrochlorin ferrochelatase [Caldilineae bacterium]|nr:MAG: bifunctional precorrin-2 dehydrogenase/sirohydrochlorin ferrochelatase [Caldilineae bacterium]